MAGSKTYSFFYEGIVAVITLKWTLADPPTKVGGGGNQHKSHARLAELRTPEGLGVFIRKA